MIRIHRPVDATCLSAKTRRALARRQAVADGYSVSDPAILKAWANFLRSIPRHEVDQKLKACFFFKCAFCENVNAISIDHFYPKMAYPGRMFLWGNFLLCCAPCNIAKGDYFPLAAGRPHLIDPCSDEPLDHLYWDELSGAVYANTRRGVDTCRRLGLDAEPLRKERFKKLTRVLHGLARVVNENPVSDEVQQDLRHEFDPHSPWLGIVRQLFKSPAPEHELLVRRALEKLPAINDWTIRWL